MKTQLFFLLGVLGIFQSAQAQVVLKMGMARHSYSTAELHYTLGENEFNTMSLDMPTGSSFFLPLQLGATVGEDLNYDVGLGLNIGSLKLESAGQEYKTRLLSPNFFVEYYLVNRWFPLQFGIGAAVSYSKVKLDWTSSLPGENDQLVEYTTQTTWGGLGYGVSLLGRYWLDDDMSNAVQFGVGNRADWRKLKTLNVNGEEVSFQKGDMGNRYDTEGLFFQISYVRVFGE